MTFKIDNNVPLPTGPHWVWFDHNEAEWTVGDEIPDAGFVLAMRYHRDEVRYLVTDDKAAARRCDPGGW